MADSRFAGRVREDGRVEKRRERPLKPVGRSIRQSLEQRDEDTCGIRELVRGEVVLSSCQRLEDCDDGCGNSERLGAPLPLSHPINCPGDYARDVPRDSV